jgi:hypothetical protein
MSCRPVFSKLPGRLISKLDEATIGTTFVAALLRAIGGVA